MSQEDQLFADQISVRELMRLESAQAINQVRAAAVVDSKTVTAWPQPEGKAQQAGLRLVAVYGSGNRLLAQVDIGGDHFLFEQGRSHPSGKHNKDTAYVLESISKACVRLRRDETAHNLCLYPDFRAPQ